MTLQEVLDLSLKGAGLSTSVAAYEDHARDYFNMGKDDISSRHRKWRWLRRKNTSLRTTASQQVDTLASDVLYPLKFWNATDDLPVEIIDPDRIGDFDPDIDDTGPVTAVAIAEINESSGLWEVEWAKIPDANNDAIYYSYIKHIPHKTSSNDGTDLGGTFPTWVQHAMVAYVKGMLKNHYGGSGYGNGDLSQYQDMVALAIQNDIQIDGRKRTRMTRRRGRGHASVAFKVQAGTL